MKWSVPPFRMVAPLLVLALSACSNPSTAPLLVDSELGQPLADTRRSGETVLDRQSEPAPKPPVQHRVTNSARGHAPADDNEADAIALLYLAREMAAEGV